MTRVGANSSTRLEASVDLPLTSAWAFCRSGAALMPKQAVQDHAGAAAHSRPAIRSTRGETEHPDSSRPSSPWMRRASPHAQYLQLRLGPALRYLQGDFSKNGVFVEVEFGNCRKRLFRDLFKFQIAGSAGAGEVGVLVVASSAVASRSSIEESRPYEQAEGLLEYMKIGLSLPTVIVGLDVNDWAANPAVATRRCGRSARGERRRLPSIRFNSQRSHRRHAMNELISVSAAVRELHRPSRLAVLGCHTPIPRSRSSRCARDLAVSGHLARG